MATTVNERWRMAITSTNGGGSSQAEMRSVIETWIAFSLVFYLFSPMLLLLYIEWHGIELAIGRQAIYYLPPAMFFVIDFSASQQRPSLFLLFLPVTAIGLFPLFSLLLRLKSTRSPSSRSHVDSIHRQRKRERKTRERERETVYVYTVYPEKLMDACSPVSRDWLSLIISRASPSSM